MRRASAMSSLKSAHSSKEKYRQKRSRPRTRITLEVLLVWFSWGWREQSSFFHPFPCQFSLRSPHQEFWRPSHPFFGWHCKTDPTFQEWLWPASGVQTWTYWQGRTQWVRVCRAESRWTSPVTSDSLIPAVTTVVDKLKQPWFLWEAKSQAMTTQDIT